jgi:hypothetical protein
MSLIWMGIEPMAAQQSSAPPFRINVVEGEGAINNIRQPVNRGAAVLIEDENHNPLSGVSVTFFLPTDGPSGLFPNGSRVLTVFSDDKGLAASRGINFNNQIGIMRMRVVASLFSQNTTAVITQTNVGSGSSVKSAFVPAAGGSKLATRSHTKRWVVLGVLAGVAAGGAYYYFGVRKVSPTASVSVGAPTVGTPTIGGPK